MDTNVQQYIVQLLSDKVQEPVNTFNWRPTGDASINKTYQVTINRRFNYFLKTNSSSAHPDLFTAECHGLSLLREAQVFYIPALIDTTTLNDTQLLLLEWIEPGQTTRKFWSLFGEKMAALHKVTGREFGLNENNFMGALPQDNSLHDNWADFFIERRLKPQVKMAMEKKLLKPEQFAAFSVLYTRISTVFDEASPSLLHGDCWNGNFICDTAGQPVLIDPAVYYGHRSMDLGMTVLFGGFNKLFYEAYHYHFPLPPNHREQWQLANLYPLLIHLNLFGTSYIGLIDQALERFQ